MLNELCQKHLTVQGVPDLPNLVVYDKIKILNFTRNKLSKNLQQSKTSQTQMNIISYLETIIRLDEFLKMFPNRNHSSYVIL